mmetsp:Transcript_20000/g.14710  ORF Transcript_20000/g.14710 Transcript_20000/m.14710 type:complete len:183 (+) Transcript_20000:386-934(+)
MKVGIDFENRKLKFKDTYDLKSKLFEAALTYHCCKVSTLGAQFVYDVNAGKLTTYNAGAVWEPAENSFLGLKHESVDKENIKLGKFMFYFFHRASENNTIGSEFTLNWATKVIGGRMGVNHKLNCDTNLKIKIDSDGNLAHALKYQVNKHVGVTVTHSGPVLDLFEGKTAVSPLGFALDIKI